MARRGRSIYCCKRVNPGSAVLALLLAAGVMLLNVRLGPLIRDMAAYQARTIATQAVSRAVAAALEEQNVGYNDLAFITRNGIGDVTSVQANMPRINTLSTSITQEIIRSVEELSNQAVEMPLGTLLGGQFFSGRGPRLSFYVVPTGSVHTNIQNEFTSAGINQTLHRILLKTEIGIMGVIPGYSSSTLVQTDICLAETVIIGSVPEYFTQIDGAGGEDLPGLVADYGPGAVTPQD